MNIISEGFVENANATAVDTSPEFDEWALSSLTKEKCVREHNSTLILAHVKYFHVPSLAVAVAVVWAF
ncbi:hypothetical protein C8R48DRAFT_718979, partial [Suillus tomentosus]